MPRVGLYLPHLALQEAWAFLQSGDAWKYFSVIFPMALFNVIGSLQNLESAEAAGDRYATCPSLAVNGVGSLVAGLLGSPFPTTIYIGHPGWKAMGARIGYSALNGVVIGALCFAGIVAGILLVVPLEITLGILIWIGIVITAQAFQEIPKSHALAAALGLIPGLAAWGQMLVESACQASGTTLAQAAGNFGSSLYIDGLLALSQGFMLSGMVLAALVAFVLEGRYSAAAGVALTGAVMSLVGLIHAYNLTPAGVEVRLEWMAAPGFAFAYAAVAGILLLAPALSLQNGTDCSS